MNERRFHSFEFRAAGSSGSPGTLAGVVMPYGVDTELAPGIRERFEAGAFGPDVAGLDVVANRQHQRGDALARTGGGGLVLADAPDALRATLELPDTQSGRDVATLASRGVLRGFSVEFAGARDAFVGGVRVVREARLIGLAVVDTPAYGDALASLRARAAEAGRTRRRILL